MSQQEPLSLADASLQLRGLMQGEPDLIANSANFSALLAQQLRDINWLGFYFLQGDELVLGPFQGKRRLVFAPTKYLDQEHLDVLRIDFAQLPFEIYQLVR